MVRGVSLFDYDLAPSLHLVDCCSSLISSPDNLIEFIDLRDFIAKASYISQTKRPSWLTGKMIDLRLLASTYFSLHDKATRLARRSPSPPISSLPAITHCTSPSTTSTSPLPVAATIIKTTTKSPPLLSIPHVLLALSLPPFIGKLHSGLADTRNAARILKELAGRGHPLLANRIVPEGGKGGKERSWGWMRGKGVVAWEGWLEKEIRKERGREGFS
jgi:3'-5' exoribonuclease 1